jgi:ketosteroid isomerase-like protein
MGRIGFRVITILTIHLACFCLVVSAQNVRGRIAGNGCGSATAFNGVFQIDVDSSDKLYSVIEEASSNVPFAEQQQFFIDLAVRLTPPDLLAIECNSNRVSLASSRAPRVEFLADGVTRNARGSDGRVVRSRIAFVRNSLVFDSTGSSDNVSFTFTPIENGRRLRVTRRITSRELIEPVVINTVYNRISDVARWDIFSTDAQVARRTNDSDTGRTPSSAIPRARTVSNGNSEAANLRQALNEWISATNARNIEKQMSFYMPQLKAFYLTRNTPRSAVRAEKNRAFARAKSIDIRAAEPEIIFQDGEQTAIMRFRKKYNIQTGARTNSGEVVQELRWQRSGGDWKIFSERDIRVLR